MNSFDDDYYGGQSYGVDVAYADQKSSAAGWYLIAGVFIGFGFGLMTAITVLQPISPTFVIQDASPDQTSMPLGVDG